MVESAGFFPNYIKNKRVKLKVAALSLFYNSHLSLSYVADIILEPCLWFVDNFTVILNRVLVFTVIFLTASVVVICFLFGLPYWWQRNWHVTVLLILIGHWILINVIFHYYMGCTVSPGYPPVGVFIPEAASMCKKCIAPKPPRTHHCSVCNRCVLKMDHHCPWLNNCVGFQNHHHFFLYMAYTFLGVLFISIFGIEMFLERVWWAEEELQGHSVKNVDDVLIAVEMGDDSGSQWERRALEYIALLSVGVMLGLGCLTVWHARLISRGETSVESHINKTEQQRYTSMGLTYMNPYDFGITRNWVIFLGIDGFSSWRAFQKVAFPSLHPVYGNGLTWKCKNC